MASGEAHEPKSIPEHLKEYVDQRLRHTMETVDSNFHTIQKEIKKIEESLLTKASIGELEELNEKFSVLLEK